MLEGKAKASGFSGIDITGGLVCVRQDKQSAPLRNQFTVRFFLLFAVKVQGAIEVLLHQIAQVCGGNNFNCRSQSQ